MRKPAFDKIFDPNDPERQEKMWQQYRTAALALMLIVCAGYFLLVGDRSADPAPVSEAIPTQPEVIEVGDVVSFSGELQIGNDISAGFSSLTIVETIEIEGSSGRVGHHGFAFGVPKRIATAAGNDIPISEPKISIIMLNQLQSEDNLMESGSVWWRVKLGPQSTPLPPGLHSYDVLATIENVRLFSQSGGGSITFPVVPPSSARVGRAQATVLLPDYASASAIAARAWIAKADHDSAPSDRRLEIGGALSIRAAAGLSKERRALTFTSPRPLEPTEGIWVQVNW